jgi:signal peptidase I
VAACCVFVIKYFIVQNFRVPTGSMENTILIGDFLFANKFIYGTKLPRIDKRFFKLRDPVRGDIIVFRYPLEPRKAYIKRCVGLPGDTLKIKDKAVYVNGTRLMEAYVTHNDKRTYPAGGVSRKDPEYQKHWEMSQFIRMSGAVRDNFGPVVIPEGSYFMLGDNRDNSLDSRYWGPVAQELILGKALFLYWSWDPGIPFHRIWDKIRWRRIGRPIG